MKNLKTADIFCSEISYIPFDSAYVTYIQKFKFDLNTIVTNNIHFQLEVFKMKEIIKKVYKHITFLSLFTE